jgi:beta-galactosidase GanA
MIVWKQVLMSCAICLLAAVSRGQDASATAHRFSFGGADNSEFLLDGQPFQIRAGEMHPDRIPPEYWRHRIRMAKAMGLNTAAIYVFWNAHEPEEGRYDFTSPARDVGAFLRIARDEGMWVLLRPGPYCCGEWDFGGIPTYLPRYPDLKLRALADARYAKAVEHYLRELAGVVRPNLVENGGSILMVQIENEYGGIFKGHFNLDTVADTFLDMSKWKKGVVWVNGHNLGRFWFIGPQQRLFCPAPWLEAGANDIVVLDLVMTEPQPLEGKTERN